jgi:hypothetical protein
MLNSKPFFLSRNFFFFITILALWGCAAQQKPQGGPRDLTPPKILKATPENQTRNFKAKQIQIDFDEYFRLTNQYQEISITPFMEKQPEYKISKKSLVIDFKDSLLKNTTYVINFGKAVADVNEGNVLKNFTYVFSTGSHIDSLSLSGNVINSTTGLKEKDALVFLFPVSQDSLLFGKKKPTIFTTTDTAGNFSLNNLREDTYRIYALKQPSPDKIFKPEADLIGFSNKSIVVDKDSSNIVLKLFKQVPDNFRVAEKHFMPDGKYSMVFNKPLEKPSLKILYPPALDKEKIAEFSKTRDTAIVYMRNMAFDSVSIAILDNNKPVDTVYQLKSKNEKFERNLVFSFGTNRDNKLKPGTDLLLTANFPLENFDLANIALLEDSVAVSNFTLQKDTANLRRYTMKYRWRANSKYQLNLTDGAFTDIYGDKSKRSGKPFTIDKPENYSQLTLKVSVPADTGKMYIVELMDDIKTVVRRDIITKNTSLLYKNFFTSKYTVRVVYDANKNGRWDSGNVKRREQPEVIWVSPKDIVLRANWEAEEPLDIPKEQTNP